MHAIGLMAAVLTAAIPAAAEAKPAKVFDTPEAAAQGMIDALGANTRAAIEELLGDEHNDTLFTEDEAAEQENRKLALAAAKEAMSLQEEDSRTRTMLIGKQQWPVPFPIVKTDAGWQFDTEAGLYELLARRIGGNELAAIATLRAYVEAQREYATTDYDNDDVLEYAQKLASTEGKKDGLYWEVADGSNEPASPLGEFVLEQAGYLSGRDQGDPLRGYDFRILTRQGDGAPGGRHDYIINGNMIAGFGLIATPSDYGVTGVMTFVVSQSGKVYEADLGEDTELVTAAIQQFDLDDGWSVVKK
ncbi:MAG TPA: DUF2950 domain-containing protein [Dongiaceae bacterium]|nr:DUF2950 domain-containing protein [Dongiaceae bacterium]